MQERKIIKFGNSSYVVTLPLDWIKEHNLDKNASVFTKTNKNSILISTQSPEQTEKNATIVIDDIPFKLFNKKLMSYYLKNCKFIRIEGKSIIERVEEIKVLVNKLSSLEIVEVSTNYIILKNLLNPRELVLDELLHEIITLELSLFDELSKKPANTTMQIVTTLDTNINKLSFLAYKCLNYNIESWDIPHVSKNAIHYWRIISSFEAIGDIMKRIMRYLTQEEGQETIAHIKTIADELKQYYIFTTNLLKENINIENNLPLYLDKKQSLLRQIEQFRTTHMKNANIMLVTLQLFKDIIGQLDTITISIIDIKS